MADKATKAVARYNFGPMTERSRSGLSPADARAYAPSTGEDVAAMARALMSTGVGDRVAPVVRALTDYGPLPAQIATDIAKQPVRAGEALGKALADPSLPNITNAGAQTALALFRPVGAAGILAGGYGVSALEDLGLFGSEANAQNSEAEVRRRLQAMSSEELKAYQNMIGAEPDGRLGPNTMARALAYEARIQGANDAEANRKLELDKLRVEMEGQAKTEAAKIKAAKDAEEANAAKKQERLEYDRAVRNAERVRDAALAEDKRFDRTAVGKMYDETGGLAAFLAATGAGAVTPRLASRVGKFMPEVAGFGGALAALNAPTLYNMTATPNINPERTAYERYARELPPTHPRKQEMAEYAAGLPQENPVQVTAAQQFKDLLPYRIGGALLEGPLGGMLGADLVRAPMRAIKGIADDVGTLRGSGAAGRGGDTASRAPSPPPEPHNGHSGGPDGQQSSYAAYDQSVHGPVSRQYLDELLTRRHPTRIAADIQQGDIGEHMAQELGRRYQAQGVPAVDPAGLAERARGSHERAQSIANVLQDTNAAGATAPRIREQMLNAITGQPGTLAIPAGIGLGAASMSEDEREALIRALMNRN